ncbi:coiled-coil domain-containing protein 180-like isoform X2 [Dreissena polymorpha]|uniref:coiled-coil domain-containing protein 180-like isoform X2 n=1 Tax=Dreissena polymorpha TaxID=45954 RepID=UPI002264E465|nr:coiled-coil domain-containing protein 180-like isoform X2 [Dreissena polymorpha]
MAETKSMRVVPSGKIYRQMFEAQVQLNRSLTKIQRDSTTVTKSSQLGASVPVVHLTKDDIEHGLLDERQRTWADGFPNDPFTENPVAYKQYAEYIGSQMKEPVSSIEGREVRGLPDVVVAAKDKSNIIERIAASRKERHESTVDEMQQELSLINAEMEPRISEACSGLLQRLEEDDKEIARKLARIETDKDLLSFSLNALNNLWADIQAHSEQRQSWIVSLDDSLKKVEDDRMEMIRQVFKDYAKTLEKIAHILAPDLQRFLDKESQMINQTVLSNRRAYGDLYVRLMSSDIERERAQNNVWRRRVDDWKILKTELAIEQFRTFMEADRVVSPVEVQKQLTYMLKEQEILNQKRLELVNQLRDLMPPSSTKTSVYHWNKGIQDISQEIDTTNQIHLSKLHKEYETVCQDCLQEIERIKLDLLDTGVCSESRAKSVVEEFMIPLVGERQGVYERNLETMERALEEQNKMSGEQLKSLFKFAQGAAHVWDVHEIGLARQERSLQEKLEQCRQTHDNQNQDKEAHLDIIMDRMRQDATEKALKDSLTRALEMLDKIRHAYEVFHSDQENIVKQYPDMVKSELNNYDEALCKLFSLDRNKPSEQTREATQDSITPDDTIVEDGMVGKKKSKTPLQKPVKPEQPKEIKDIPSAINEVLQTKKGTMFYVLTVAGEHGIPAEYGGVSERRGRSMSVVEATDDPAFMTEVSGLSEDQDWRPDYIKTIDVPESLLVEIRKIIRLNFLNHLEDWTDQASERASSVVVAKCEELNSELDLRLHLHKPRARRAEYDVHNVRAAELVMHSERVTRHCKGITQALTEVRNRFVSMTTEHNELASKFRKDIEALEVVFINATKASKLYNLKNQLNVELDKFMSVIRASLRQFRQHLDETLQMLRESNARFIKSFKVFSDGGNFCPEEIEDYRKRLDKMAANVDKAEGSIMSDLEDMESKRLEQATKVAMEFEDRFKSHMFDLIFMEKIARWLTNTQVKIKAEVAESNTHAQKLAKHLSDIERRIDACARPNLDKEQITSDQLNASLKGVFEAFHTRSVYLNCLKDPTMRPPSSAMQGPPAVGARVGFVQDSGPTPISKAGKQPAEDPSVGVIKGIMRTNKSKMRFGLDAELDGEYAQSAEAREKAKSAMSTTNTSDRGKASQVRHGLSPASASESIHRKTQSAAMRRTSKPAKYERKTVIFGDAAEDETDNTSHFLGIVRKTLREALEGLFAASEMYYRQKGMRPVTRPQALQETYELCADVIVQKLQSYYQQADEYHNQCLQGKFYVNALKKGLCFYTPITIVNGGYIGVSLSVCLSRNFN